MKKYMINPITGEKTEIENTECKWQVVEVHYSVSSKRFRAVCIGTNNVIMKERLFDSRVEAEIFIGEQRNESV